jgi:hypothetical protein
MQQEHGMERATMRWGVALGAVVGLLVACSSDTNDAGSTSGSSGTNAGTCEAVCQNFASQCAAEFMNPKCVEECKSKNLSAAALGCCANVKFPAGKCEAEGAGEVGAEDCDDVGCE